MIFAHGSTVTRLRAGPAYDSYAETTTNSDWDNPALLQIPGAFIAQSSTATVSTATRSQAIEAKSLYCAPDADVRTGDRIQDGAAVYTVDGIPAADTNPFTGWQPIREIPLSRGVG